VAGLARAFGSGAMTNSVPEIEDADCILITGSNTSEAHPLVARRVFRAKEKGAKLIVIEPRRIQMAQVADIHARNKPGSDVAWINGLMHIIIKEGWEDKDFIAQRTEGFEKLKIEVEAYPPEKAAEISGIPPEDLRRIAETYAKAEKASILYAMGITQHTTGTDNVLSLANLAMITGNLGRPSTGVNPLRGQNNVQGACDVGALPNVYPGYQSVSDKDVAKRFEEAWGVGLDQKVGLTIPEMVSAIEEGKVKAMYILAENPLLSDPDVNHLEKAIKKLDLLVVQDIFMTETAQLAHVVLPGVSFAEKDGTFTATDRRVQRVRKAIDPVGEARPDWEILCDVAQRMGGKGFSYASPKEIFDELATVTPVYQGIRYERIEQAGLQWPCRSPEDHGTPYLHKDQFAKGSGTFHAIAYRGPAELPDDEFPLVLTTGRMGFHFHTGTMTRVSPSLHKETETAYMEIHPEDAQMLRIDEGENVRVSSRRGTIDIKATVTDRAHRGVVFIPFHFVEAAANRLTHSALDPVAKIPEFKVCAVKVERIGKGQEKRG
jgi:formate dehydrogenase alpha subunit